jgi:hypothetical protein
VSRRFISKIIFLIAGIILPIVMIWSCSNNQSINQSINQSPSQVISKDVNLATRIGKGIIESCPTVDSGDSKAQEQCAQKLAKFDLMRDSMAKEVLWGGQKELGNFNLKDSNTTYFDPLIFRRLYLSTFMFSGEPKIEEKDKLTVIHLPVTFRNKLDAGMFPYPFWHSDKKWTSYHQATEILLMMENGKIRGGLRSANKDKSRQVTNVKWDGQWQWKSEDGQQSPKVTLYKSLFSEANPHVQKLDNTYRKFEVKMRAHSCTVCHNPSNANEMNPLLILSYPNQALTLRHETLARIKAKTMPPPKGIADESELNEMIKLATAFAEEGDKALAYEGEKSSSRS